VAPATIAAQHIIGRIRFGARRENGDVRIVSSRPRLNRTGDRVDQAPSSPSPDGNVLMGELKNAEYCAPVFDPMLCWEIT
jgi:hypothetical protein